MQTFFGFYLINMCYLLCLNSLLNLIVSFELNQIQVKFQLEVNYIYDYYEPLVILDNYCLTFLIHVLMYKDIYFNFISDGLYQDFLPFSVNNHFLFYLNFLLIMENQLLVCKYYHYHQLTHNHHNYYLFLMTCHLSLIYLIYLILKVIFINNCFGSLLMACLSLLLNGKIVYPLFIMVID